MKRFTLWVVEYYEDMLGPTVKQYEATELRKTGAKVVVRGFDQFIRHASNRTFHTTLKDVEDRVRYLFTHAEDQLMKRLARMRERRDRFTVDVQAAEAQPHVPLILD